jgi:hypothetical protein
MFYWSITPELEDAMYERLVEVLQRANQAWFYSSLG